ncbi:hypothetical protein TNCV_651561 [Trichonephila clavipes]|nr:hypothetical protein TNCV_651561 [Trichonephila clavipes]
MTPGVSSVCLGHGLFDCRRSPDVLLNSNPSSTELWLDTTGIVNGNGLESVEYTLQVTWLGTVLDITDFYQLVALLWYQLQLEFLPQTQYDLLQPYVEYGGLPSQ